MSLQEETRGAEAPLAVTAVLAVYYLITGRRGAEAPRFISIYLIERGLAIDDVERSYISSITSCTNDGDRTAEVAQTASQIGNDEVTTDI